MQHCNSCTIITNPTAGRGEAGRSLAKIRKELGAETTERLTWLFTKGRGDAEQFAREAVARGDDLVVAVGGDGTLHEVANGVMGTETAVGLIPFGTGNDLARALGLHGNLSRACDAINNGKTISVDVGTVEGAGTNGQRHFLVLAGAGFDSRTAQTVNEGVKWIGGAAAYVIGAVLTLRNFEPFDLEVTPDGGDTIKTRAMFVSVANTANTGGGMILAPGAVPTDGLLDICLVSEVSKPVLLYELTRVFKGDHVKNPAVRMIRASTVHIQADPPQPLLIDGEVLGTTPLKIGIMPGALKMRVPRDATQ